VRSAARSGSLTTTSVDGLSIRRLRKREHVLEDWRASGQDATKDAEETLLGLDNKVPVREPQFFDVRRDVVYIHEIGIR
jgi:hypothetical protein